MGFSQKLTDKMGFSQKLTAISRTMSFQTPKFVKIVDWRLATLHYALSLAIAIYVFLNIFLHNNYLATEIPVGRLSTWGNAEKSYYPAQAASRAAAVPEKRAFDGKEYSLVPCAGGLGKYGFELNDDEKYTDVRCTYLPANELITKSATDDIFITTHLQETVTFRAPEPAGGCTSVMTYADGEEVDLSSDLMEGLCSYEKITDWLTVGAEHIKIGIKHELSTQSTNYHNPTTKVRRAGNSTNLLVFDEGKEIEFSLEQILDFAQVDLDRRYADQPGPFDNTKETGVGPDGDLTPMLRLAGLRINMSIKYYNYNLDRNTFRIGKPVPYAILEIAPNLVWTDHAQQITYRSDPGALADPIRRDGLPEGYVLSMHPYGINIDVSTGGAIGHFDYVRLVNALVAGVVLLGVAGAVCTAVAKHLLGTKSKIYSRKILEEVDFAREAAKYALQGMLATEQYNRVDGVLSAGDGITLDELHHEIKRTFCREGGTDAAVDDDWAKEDVALTDNECMTLAMYIMQAGDFETKERFLQGLPRRTPGQMVGKNISLAEWTEIMTGETLDVRMLKECIKKESERISESECDDIRRASYSSLRSS